LTLRRPSAALETARRSNAPDARKEVIAMHTDLYIACQRCKRPVNVSAQLAQLAGEIAGDEQQGGAEMPPGELMTSLFCEHCKVHTAVVEIGPRKGTVLARAETVINDERRKRSK
jgi:hypothetical protein